MSGRPDLRRFLLLSTAVAALAMPAGAMAGPGTSPAPGQLAQAAGPAALSFQIPPQPLDTALTTFADQAGLQLLFSAPDATAVASRGLSGSFTVDEGLRRLLAGTGFVHRFTGAGTVTVERQAAGSRAVGGGRAQTAGGPVTLEPVTVSATVVTASGFEQQIKDAPASISIITRQELEKKAFRDLTDALRDIEGVAVTGPANEKDIYIRGMPGSYTLILVDGKRQSTRDTRTNGNSGFEQSFIPPLEAIERIEVVRGPMSSLYGSDAMGGVINIITRKVAKEWGGSVSADYVLQDHGRSGDWYQGQFYLNGPVVPDYLGLQVWGRQYQRWEDDIVTGHAGARDRDITGRLSLTPTPDHDILFEAGRTWIRREADSGKSLEASAADTYNKHRRDHWSISHTGRWGFATSDISLYQETAQRWSYTRNAEGEFARSSRAPKIRNTVADAKISIPFETPIGDHYVVTGGQWLEGKLTDQNPGRRTGKDEVFKIWQRALFIEDEWRITDNFALTGGLRLDDHEIYGVHWSPRGYAVWHPTDELTLKGGVSTGFRAPEIRSIAPGYAYTTGGANCSYGPNGTCGVIIGDPNLKAETSTNYEISAHWDDLETFAAGITLFYTEFKDKVSNALVYDQNGQPARWSEDPNYRLWYAFNIDEATIKGVELTARWRPVETLTLKASYTYTDSEQKTGDYKGQPLARTPKHQASLRADWATPVRGLSLWGATDYHGKEINAGARIGSNGKPVTSGGRILAREYDDYMTFDIGAVYEVTENALLKAAVYNIANKRLDPERYNTVGDGRQFWIGTTVRF